MKNHILVLAITTSILLTTAIGMAQTTTTPTTAPEARIAVPDAAAVKESTKLAKEVFKVDLENAKSPEQKAALVDKILHQADESKDDPVARFALLQMAAEHAAGVGDVNRTLQATEEMAKTYDISNAKIKSMIVPKLVSSLKLLGGGQAALNNLLAKEYDNPVSPADQMKIGDGWWELGKMSQDVEREYLFARACKWYQWAVPNLTGLLKAKVEARLAEKEEPPKSVTASTDSNNKEDAKPLVMKVQVWTWRGKEVTYFFANHIATSTPNHTGTWSMDDNIMTVKWETGSVDSLILSADYHSLNEGNNTIATLLTEREETLPTITNSQVWRWNGYLVTFLPNHSFMGWSNETGTWTIKGNAVMVLWNHPGWGTNTVIFSDDRHKMEGEAGGTHISVEFVSKKD